MKKIILFLFLGCCGILSGCHGNETFEENCIGFYQFFTTWKHKCDEYRDGLFKIKPIFEFF